MRVCVLLPALFSVLLLLEPGLAGPLPEQEPYDVQETYGCKMPLATLCNHPELAVTCDRKTQCDDIRKEFATMPPFPEDSEASIAIAENPK